LLLKIAGKHPHILITAVTPGKLCSVTELRAGMELVSINDFAFPNGAAAIEHMRQTFGTIAFVARKPAPKIPADIRRLSDHETTEVICATVFKPTETTSVGMAVKGRSPNIEITKISPGSLSSQTDLQVGMGLVSINGVFFQTSSEAIDFLRQSVGTLRIIAVKYKTVSATIFKPNPETSVGISLKGGFPAIKIINLKPGSLSSGTSLRPGMSLVSINGLSFNTAADAIQPLKSTMGTIDVKARDDMIVTTVRKEGQNQAVGLSLRGRTPHIAITGVNPGGLCGETGLQPGLVLVSINNNVFPTSVEAISFLQEAVGELTIAAQPESLNGDSNAVTASTTGGGPSMLQSDITMAQPISSPPMRPDSSPPMRQPDITMQQPVSSYPMPPSNVVVGCVDINAVRQAINRPDINYSIVTIGPDVFVAERGDLVLNILCGCCLQYFKFCIDASNPQSIVVVSQVPCNGFWGGLIGMARNDSEKRRVQAALQQVFTERQVIAR
jgi:hypothetical protein